MRDYDRTVHGKTTDGREIVRYDRAGKWYLEGGPGNRPRQNVTLKRAAEEAAAGEFYGDKPGGQMFDAKVRRLLAAG